jgi:hypothetical protein
VGEIRPLLGSGLRLETSGKLLASGRNRYGAWADGGSAEQRGRGGAGSSAPAERVKAAARVEGRREGGWGAGGAVGSQFKGLRGSWGGVPWGMRT